jgi:hypothetical protein
MTLNSKEINVNQKRTLLIALFGELTLEGAMDLYYDRQKNE